MDDDDGRRRRGRILSIIGAVVLVVAAGYGFAAHWGADRRLDELGDRLHLAFDGTTRADLDLQLFPPAGGGELSLDEFELPTGERPREAIWDDQEAVARYDVSYWTESRCVIVTWTSEGVSFRSLDGADCNLG